MASGADDPTVEQGRVLLSGYVLRAFLLLTLREAGSTLAVADLVDRLDRAGLRTHGRPSKDVSDALRWEVRRGRVHRVARAAYRVGHVHRQTAWRMRRRLDDHVRSRGG